MKSYRPSNENEDKEEAAIDPNQTDLLTMIEEIENEKQ